MTATYNIPIDQGADHDIIFRAKQFDLTGYTAKSQFRSNNADDADGTLLLDLSTTNGKITIAADPLTSGDYLITLNIKPSRNL